MDTTVANPATTTLIPAAPGLGGRWQALPVRLQIGAMFGVAGLLAVLAFMTLGAKDSNYRPLYTNISDKDGGQIISRLTQMNVPYKVAEGGSVVLVPSGQVHALRMKLAAAGLNLGGSGGSAAGYELLDKDSFGQTQGQERMKFKRVTEGELITSIQSLESVKSARVHLALPQQNGFFREQQKPSASVVLTLNAGRTLDRSQVAGIVSLVASSVPELSAKAVSVVDSTGALLSGPGDEAAAQGLDSQQLQYRREVEAGFTKRVLALLEPVVGSDNVRVSITGDIDFSQVMQTAEAYRPNQGEGVQPAIREQRTEENTQAGSATPSGVPGAASNQPPTPATAPINGAAQGLQGTQPGSASGGAARREAATRFEVDKTTTVTRNAVGNVRRLSAAVVVNNRTSTDAKGKTSTVPLSEKEIEQLTALVQQGIGFNAERGDVVKVINAPFRTDALPPDDNTPLWQQPWLLDLLKTAAAPLALALVALVIISKLIRPAFTAMTAPPPPPEKGSQLDEMVADDTPPPKPLLLAATQSERVEQARAMAKANPAAVANIVRGWVNGGAA